MPRLDSSLRPALMHDACHFTDRIAAAWRPDAWRGVHVVIGVSGGADSVALLRAMADLKADAGGDGELLVAHYDHGCRGDASRADAQWVERLAVSLGLRCTVGRSEGAGERSEESLRDERRGFFAQVSAQAGARYVATAHTADDQAETVLFRVLRGSGLGGLRGIAPFKPLTPSVSLARPMLDLMREEVLAYLESLGQGFRTDATNASLAPTRNWIRHDLLPQLAERFGDAPQALRRLADRAAEADDVLQRLAADLLAEAEPDDAAPGVRLNCRVLAAAASLVAREAIRRAWRRAGWPEQAMRSDHWQRLAALAMATDPPPETYPGQIRAEVRGGFLTLSGPEAND